MICAFGQDVDGIEDPGKAKGMVGKTTDSTRSGSCHELFPRHRQRRFFGEGLKAYMALVGDGRGGVFCANSLARPEEWPNMAQEKVTLNTFDVVLTNPPFGNKIVVKGSPILSQYELAYQWKHDKKTKEFARTSRLPDDQPPQLLFWSVAFNCLKTAGGSELSCPRACWEILPMSTSLLTC